MKKFLYIIALGLIFVLMQGCAVSNPITKAQAYDKMYSEKPIAILVMPPINRSTNVEAKGYFHSTLCVPLANAGYYVIPPFLSMEMLKKESAYDAELFLDAPVNKFGEYFGADVALFTIIHRWDKSALAAKVYVDIEYILKSTKTNEVIFSRIGHITYDASVSSGSGGLLGALVDMAASAISTALTQYVSVARSCNSYTLSDLPAGKYSPNHELDGTNNAGLKDFKVTLR